jgi:hypothetical protein
MTSKKIFVLASTIILCCVFALWALFRGYFDNGTFTVLKSLPLTDKTIAILAERSDTSAMNSPQYFVVVTDHLYDPKELKFACHSSQPVFSGGGGVPDIDSRRPNELVVVCRHCGIKPSGIATRKFTDGEVTIQYEGFPE